MTPVQETANKIAANIPAGKVHDLVNASLAPDATCYDQVLAFHALYEAPIADKALIGLPQMDDARLALRLDLIEEEFTVELKEAVEKRDIIEIADALGDIIYVACGFAIEAGIDLKAVLAEIHASNMTKLAEDGSVIRRDDGKILKGPNYQKPNIAAVINPVSE